MPPNPRPPSSPPVFSLSLTGRIEKLQEKYRGKIVAIAYSGGVDSGTLLAVLKPAATRLVAFTITAQNVPLDEVRRAEEVAGMLRVELHLVQTDILQVPHFAENPPDRCYHCKLALFTKIQDRAKAAGAEVLVDGTNADDLASNDRPGLRALKELKVESPWADFGITKEEIRQVARDLGLEFAELPSAACLASRVPYQESISCEKLARIEKAEHYLRATYQLTQIRVRVHGETLARIEVLPAEIPLLSMPDAMANIVRKFQEIGFTYITLDLAGFRSGPLNHNNPA